MNYKLTTEECAAILNEFGYLVFTLSIHRLCGLSLLWLIKIKRLSIEVNSLPPLHHVNAHIIVSTLCFFKESLKLVKRKIWPLPIYMPKDDFCVEVSDSMLDSVIAFDTDTMVCRCFNKEDIFGLRAKFENHSSMI